MVGEQDIARRLEQGDVSRGRNDAGLLVVCERVGEYDA